MSIEIITVGNEVLRGMVVNTNSAYLGRRLDEEGWNIDRQTTLPDVKAPLTLGLGQALSRASFVICTGGLGSTLDDITSGCASTLFSLPAQTLNNSIGSAPGLHFAEKGRHLFLLPGVPQEMEAMFEEQILPLLPVKKKDYRMALYFSMLRENEVDPFLREMKCQAGIYPSYGGLTVVLRGKDLAELKREKEKLKQQFSSHFYQSPSGKIEEAIQLWMIQNQKTVACAESCTGGMLASQLTAIAGASKYFVGSVVTYSNQMKEKVLHVSPQTLISKGAVSAETVSEMWKGLLALTGADFGIAVSGIAGPSGGTFKKPVGTVVYAMGFKDQEPEVGHLHFKGPRSLVVFRATRTLLGLAWKQMKTFDPP